MDITIKNGLSNPLASAKGKTTGVDNAAAQNTTPASDRDGDNGNSVARDSTTISSESLRLASTSTVQGMSNQTQIPDRQKAQEMASQIVTAFANNPNQAQNAFSNVSAARTAKVLG